MAPGTTIAAVGADSAHKSKIAPPLLAASAVVTDDRAQCSAIGDLHHAVETGLMRTDRVRADLGEVVAGRARGRIDRNECVIFDSTGLPFRDVVAAALAYERSQARGLGRPIGLRD